MTTTATKPLTPAILTYDLVSAGDPQISPDGRTIVYARGQTERESKKVSSQLWLCDVDGGNARRITWSGRLNGGARWSPDGAWLAFVSDRGEKGSGLYVMPMGGGDARELSRHAQGIGDVAWSPDGRSIAYTTLVDPENPDEQERSKDAAAPVRATSRLDYKQDNRGYLGDVRTQVFVVDMESGTRRQITHQPEDYQHPQWSPDGRRLAAKAPRLTGMASQLALIALDTGAITLVGPEDGVIGVWAWSPDGGRILIAGDTRQTYQTDFFVYDVAADTMRRLTDDLQCLPEAGFPTITPPSHPVWLSNTRALFHAVRAGMSGLYTVDTESGDIEQVAGMQALNVGLSVDDAHRYAVQAHTALAAVGEISVTDLSTGETRIISHLNDALLRESPAAAWEAFTVRRGDYTIDAWLLKPPGFDPAKQYPLVLDVH